MKKTLILVVFALIVSSYAFAEESVLIDFSQLIDDYQGQNRQTFVDYSNFAGTRFTEEEKTQMSSSLNIPNWIVRLTSSSSTVINNSLSYVRPVTVSDDAARFAGEQLLGVRIHFPEPPFNSYATIEPPFEIPAYASHPFDEDVPVGQQFENFGIIKNIGVIKNIKMNVYGMNFPIGINLVLLNPDKSMQRIKMGDVEYDGWKELTWNNPNYINEVRDRELVRMPLYPQTAPYIGLYGIEFYRDAMVDGGDFISYIKDIKITYDKAILDDIDTDLNHEEIWGILSDRAEVRRANELQRLTDIEVLRFLEKKKMHTEEGEGEEQGGDNAPAQ